MGYHNVALPRKRTFPTIYDGGPQCTLLPRPARREEEEETQRNLSGAEKVEFHVSGYSLPVPDGNPVTDIHESPDLLEEFTNPIRVAKSSVASDCPHGRPDSLSLRRRETGGADDETRDQKEGLAWVAGLEAVQNREGLLYG